MVRESKVLDLDTGYISVPREISWTTDGDQISHGYFYPPQVGSEYIGCQRLYIRETVHSYSLIR